MFLRKITKIESVGKFRRAGIHGGEYARGTLFYAGNGRGKTTLCAILRSLTRGDPSLILERRSFRSAEPPRIELLLSAGPTKFSSGTWSLVQPDIHIFDQQYINETVHVGDQVEVGHRRNLYRVAVGPKGVALARAIDDLDKLATTKQNEISAQKKLIQQHLPKGTTFEAFVALKPDTDVEAKIKNSEALLSAAKDASQILNRALLPTVAIPELPDNFWDILAKSLGEISVDALKRVREQLKKHSFHEEGEEWLQQGMEHLADNSCPFCGQGLTGNELISAYQGYFSEAYTAFKNDLSALRSATETAFSIPVRIKIRHDIEDARKEVAFWKRYAEFGVELAAPEAEIDKAFAEFAVNALALVDAKIASPVEELRSTPEFDAAVAEWKLVTPAIVKHNEVVKAINSQIATIKNGVQQKSLATIEADLASLKTVRVRHSEPVVSLVKSYETLLQQKQDLVTTKDTKKAELDAYDTEVLAKYVEEINDILLKFGTSFILSNWSKSYVGKIPQSEYCIKFDDTPVNVSAKGEDGDPSFKSTMSAGDKSTLALAFFLAQVNRDPDISKKLIVFDDPLSSLDDFRREMTAKFVFRCGQKSEQVIVLSHDKYFLDSVRKKIHGYDCVAMQISSAKGSSGLEPWDIEREVMDGYLQDHMTLVEFVEGNGTDAKTVRTLMRPLLEKYIRYRFPNQMGPTMWLGQMLTIIREDAGHPLQPFYQELDDINEYTAPFHHDPDTPFNPDEVVTYVKRTLAIIGGC